jgi:hypothetical protein
VIFTAPNNMRLIKSKIMKWTGHLSRIGEIINAYRFLVRKPERKAPLGKPRRG